jgi:hypothetical protein
VDDKTHTLGEQLKRWFFPTKWATFRFSLSLIGTALGLLTVALKIADYFKWTKSTDPLGKIHWYLWASLVVSLIGISLVCVLYDQLWVLKSGLQQDLKDSNSKLDHALARIGRVAGIQHAMAEVVRSYTVGNGDTLPVEIGKHAKFQELVGELREYLREIVGEHNISIVVKYMKPAPDGSEPILTAVFRSIGADQDRGERKNTMTLEESVVFKRFWDAKTRRLRRVVIRDIEKLETGIGQVLNTDTAKLHQDYKAYAERCGYRSVLAFPLREPHIPRPYDYAGVRGFLSFDCPDPNAFDRLFKTATGVADDNDGCHLEDRKCLQLFFGLADSISTIAMLLDETVTGPMTIHPSSAKE